MAVSWLILDIGNSAVKWGQFANGVLRDTGRLELDRSDFAHPAAWQAALKDVLPDAGVRAGIVSVVPDANAPAQAAVTASTGAPARVLQTEGWLPFTLAYKTPQTLGTDRLAAAAGAWLDYGMATEANPARSVLAVDAGTALTIEVVRHDATYLGGVIAPGPRLLRDALATGGAQLPAIDLNVPAHPTGTSTEHALQSGIMHGFAGMAEGLVARLEATLPDTPRILLTGGAASLLQDTLPRIDAHVPHLVLRGAYRLLVNRMEEDLAQSG